MAGQPDTKSWLISLHVRQQEQKILDLLVEKGIKVDCEGCMFWPIESEYNVQRARLKLGEAGAAGDMFAAYDLLATRAWTKLDPSQTDDGSRRRQAHAELRHNQSAVQEECIPQ